MPIRAEFRPTIFPSITYNVIKEGRTITITFMDVRQNLTCISCSKCDINFALKLSDMAFIGCNVKFKVDGYLCESCVNAAEGIIDEPVNIDYSTLERELAAEFGVPIPEISNPSSTSTPVEGTWSWIVHDSVG
jgi:hypothetical protein